MPLPVLVRGAYSQWTPIQNSWLFIKAKIGAPECPETVIISE